MRSWSLDWSPDLCENYLLLLLFIACDIMLFLFFFPIKSNHKWNSRLFNVWLNYIKFYNIIYLFKWRIVVFIFCQYLFMICLEYFIKIKEIYILKSLLFVICSYFIPVFFCNWDLIVSSLARRQLTNTYNNPFSYRQIMHKWYCGDDATRQVCIIFQ